MGLDLLHLHEELVTIHNHRHRLTHGTPPA